MKLIYGKVNDQDMFHAVIHNELRELGIKVSKATKSGTGNYNPQVSAGIFGGSITHLPQVPVPLNGFVLQIPIFLLTATSVLRQNLKAEGLFRKGGSIQRQKELKQSLENGGDLDDANVHDVANLVKQFLRCLSEPLLPPRLYGSFVKAYDLGDVAARRKAIFLLCALLPMEHLHVLHFLMVFFAEIANNKAYNKMDSGSLAIVLMPNLFILPEELDKKDKSKDKLLQKQTGLVQFLIDNYEEIGCVCDNVLDRVAASSNLAQSDDDLNETLETRTKLNAKKKRNSLNGVFNGLRKMVQQNRIPSICNDEAGFSDGSLVERTPSQATKRKLVGGKAAAQCSTAKKRTMMHLRSEKLPPISMTHLDSPDPVQNEDEVFSSPAHFLVRNDASLSKRKSGRMKFFGKTYLTKGNSTFQSPKQTKKFEKESLSSCKKRIATRHLKGGTFSESSSTNLSVPLPKPSTRSYRSILYTKANESAMSPVCQIKNKNKSNVASIMMNEVCLAEGHKKYLQAVHSKPVFAKEFHKHQPSGKTAKASTKAPGLNGATALKKTTTGTTKWFDTSLHSGKIHRLDSTHRARSFVTDSSSPMPLDQLISPARSVIWRPLTKSSLRRGRPNTVRAGLPTPSPFKASGAKSGMVHYTSDPGPMLDSTITFTKPGSDWLQMQNNADKSMSVQKVLFNEDESDKEEVFEVEIVAKKEDAEIVDVSDPRSKGFDGSGSQFSQSIGYESKNVTAEIHSLQLPKRDSGIFDLCSVAAEDSVEPMDVDVPEVEDQPSQRKLNEFGKILPKSPSVDSGINHGETIGSGDNATISDVVHPPSVNVEVFGNSPFCFTHSTEAFSSFPSPVEIDKQVSTTPHQVTDGMKWKSAVDVFRIHGGGLEEAMVGRPSLLRLMKDKAGSVTETARKYDEITSASYARSKNTKLVQRRLSLRSASPLVRTTALHHQRSVSREAVAPVNRTGFCSSGPNITMTKRFKELRKTKITSLESKENLPKGNSPGSNLNKGGDAQKTTVCSKLTARVVLTTLTGPNVQRKSTVTINRSKSARTTDGHLLAKLNDDEVLRRSPRLQPHAKVNVTRNRQSAKLQRRSSSSL